jgi:2-polyprenyl-3-methyl-5-hydroxy-6-metoxy-1,4-benzoquinol methylase
MLSYKQIPKNNSMPISYCLCRLGVANFKQTIVYKKESVFKAYEGTVIGQCTNCGLLKTFPTKTNKSFNPQVSRTGFFKSKEKQLTKLFNPVVNKIAKFKNKGTVLDVGCSSGLLLSLLQKKGYFVFGIEPNKEAQQQAQKRIGNNIFLGTLSQFSKGNTTKFDCIVYNHVLEHIEAVNEEFKLIKKHLKKGGILVIGVPNTDNIIFKIRQKYWESLMPNEHVWQFSGKYLINYLASKNFNVQDVSYYNDRRQDYPFLKQVYFRFLSLINKLVGTGEAVLIIAKFAE